MDFRSSAGSLLKLKVSASARKKILHFFIWHRHAPLSERHFLNYPHPHGMRIIVSALSIQCILWRFYLSALQSSVQYALRGRMKITISRILGLMQHPRVLASFLGGDVCLQLQWNLFRNRFTKSSTVPSVFRHADFLQREVTGIFLVPHQSSSVETSLLSEDL